MAAMKRREFLARSIAGAGSLMLGARLPAAESRPAGRYEPYEMVSLGQTNIKLTRIGIGTGMRGGNRQSNHTRLGQERFNALVLGAYERGVRWFDLADLYGTHPYLANALTQIPRKDYVLVSKIWWRRGGIPEPERPDADVVVDRFLKELRTDYLDLILLHCVVSEQWPSELSRQMEILARLKKKGIVRAHGVSCHALGALQACIEEPWVDSVHARINPYGASMDGPAEQVAPVLRQIHDAGKAVVGMKLIGEGRFRDSDEMRDSSVRYALESGCVDTMVVGFEKTEEIDDFAARVRKVETRGVSARARRPHPVGVA
ncbi:MAG: aldo/keto reductase [Sedimentisphaerales bacterium]|nr:aldo/keto reductase [Sedimentisphaerales bacterium]